MKKLLKGLEINENDNLATMFAKGGVIGTIKSSVACLGLCAVIYGLGKLAGNGSTEEAEAE